MRFAKKASLLAVLLAASTSITSLLCQATISRMAPSLANNCHRLADPQAAVAQPASPPARTAATITADAVIMNSRSFGIPFASMRLAPSQPKSSCWSHAATPNGSCLIANRRKCASFNSRGPMTDCFGSRPARWMLTARPFPGGPMKPQLKVFIDTTKPDVTLACRSRCRGSSDRHIANARRDTDEECTAALRDGRCPAVANRSMCGRCSPRESFLHAQP